MARRRRNPYRSLTPLRAMRLLEQLADHPDDAWPADEIKAALREHVKYAAWKGMRR